MDEYLIPQTVSPPEIFSAVDYRRRYGRTQMVLKKLRGPLAAADELCRVVSVDTISPNLWVTVRFSDGSTRGLRPGMIQEAVTGA